MGSIFLTLFFAIFLTIGVGILGYGVHSYRLSQAAGSWPTADGVITHSDLEIDSDSDGTTYRVRLNYQYSALGVDRTGDNIAFGYAGSSARNYHEILEDALPVGTRVAVRYDPANPERSTLSFGVHKSILFILLFGATWTMFTVGMAIMFLMGDGGPTVILRNLQTYS
ncbi:MAG: DUF3592 domain-containing protein [Pseudomonadota bacterium]